MFADPRTADRLTGLVLLLLGISMLIGGYTMDRLEIRQIHPASIPGLVPMGLGAAMIICSLLLIASAGTDHETPAEKGSFKNLLISLALCLGYAVGLLGHLPFVVATGLFIFVFSLYFTWTDSDSTPRPRLQLIALIALFSVLFSGAISLLFQYGFLVRLP